jgi:hypothetical protein
MGFNKTFFGISGANPPVQILIDYLIVAGGGGGGTADTNFAGSPGSGGGGGFKSGSLVFYQYKSTSYPITIGKGGNGGGDYTSGTDGIGSSFNSITTTGGGGGGGKQATSGRAGGSGGGGFCGGSGGNGVTGEGNRGGNGFGTGVGCKNGLGGGAGTAGTNATSGLISIAGEPKAWVDGVMYAGGGGAGYDSLKGTGGNGIDGAGYDNPALASGSAGIVAIRYPATASLATGGEITISGSYVYHYFPSSSTFTFNS